MKFRFIYKKKKYSIDVRVCESMISQANGLMFRKKSKPLLFKFNRLVRISIHSLFCVPFVAIWFKGDEVILIKYVKPWLPSIKPKAPFDKLLEIPINSPHYNLFYRRNQNL